MRKKSHYFNISKFKNWIKEKLIFSLNSLKNILKNNLESCVLQLEENKKLKNPQIILANKRLEIQKNSLRNQILLIDEKIKKLEI